MLSVAVCRCLFLLMRRCFPGRWICLLVSERFRLVWKCRLFGHNTYIQFCVHWHGGQCLQRLVPNYAVVFRLGWVTDKMKRSFFQAAVVSILLYGCTTWTLTKRLKKKLDGNYTRILRAYIEQVLEATPHKAPTIRPPTSHHENYPS